MRSRSRPAVLRPSIPWEFLSNKTLKRYVSGILFVSSFLSGCSPQYILRAAYEEGKILWRREPIVRFLERPEVESSTKEKLRVVLAAREYARDVLKLEIGGSYSSFSYVDRSELSYIVTAAPKTELRPYTWWFLIIGRVPYKGYFSKEAAEAAAAELQADGYDTSIKPSAAYSTLGWFDDPLLAHLLKYDKVTLADLVFHELFHNTLYVKGATHFNESAANFVGGRAAIEFFREKLGRESAEYRLALRYWQEELEFSDYIQKLAESLKELYARDIGYMEKLTLRDEIFEKAKKGWHERIAARPAHRFRRFSTQPINNAVMIHYLLYLKNLRLFETLYEAEGRSLPRTIDAIRRAVAKGGEPFAAIQTLIDERS